MDRTSGHLFSKTASNMNVAEKEAVTPLSVPCGENSEDDTQKTKQALVQRLKLETWTPSIGFQTRVQIIGDPMLVISGARGVESGSPRPQRAGRSWDVDCERFLRRVPPALHTESGTHWLTS